MNSRSLVFVTSLALAAGTLAAQQPLHAPDGGTSAHDVD